VATPRGERSDQCGAARLTSKMKALEAVTLLDGVKRRVHEMQFEQGFAEDVIAGGPVDTQSRQIDPGGLGHLGKRVRSPHEIISVGIPKARWIGRIESSACIWIRGNRYPLPSPCIDPPETVALQKNHWARALAAGSREVIADAKILLVDV